MPVPFAAEVTSAAWRANAEQWIAATVSDAGGRITGPIEQRRVRPWSTQLVIPTDTGRAWFKANCPALAHEAALHAELARLVPDLVDAPLGVEIDRGWLLTRDRGPTLAERGEPDQAQWCAIVATAAVLQRRLVPHAAELRATGLPDASPATVSARLDDLLERLTVLDPAHPSHLDADERARLEAARPRVIDAAATLAAGPVPMSLNHGDTHPNNVLIVDGAPRLFDFGDAQWAHPFESLWTVWSWLTRAAHRPYQPVFAAYAEVWSDLVTPSEFDELLHAAMVTLPVNRAFTWYGSVELATPAETVDWGDAPLSQLRHLLEQWPQQRGEEWPEAN